MKLRFVLFSLVLALVPIAAFAQLPDLVVTAVTPTSGPSSGGNEVVITGNHFATNVLCIVPCPPIISFGDIEVPVSQETNTRLVVTAPAHAPGTVDLSIRVADGRTTTVPNGYTFTPTAEDAWEKVLLPVYLDGAVPGSGGARWATDFWLRNDGGEAIDIAPWPCEAEVCLPVVPNRKSLQSGFSLHNLPPFFRPPGGNPSRLLFVTGPGEREFSTQLRVADTARGVLNAGTELPVVRGDEFRTGTTQLLNVPWDPQNQRVLLRLYDVTYTTAKFRVTLYAQAEGGPTQMEHSVELTATLGETGEFRSQAAFVQYDFHELTLLDKNWPDAFRIEITPLTPGSRYYPLVSITNNESQLVTLVTPQ